LITWIASYPKSGNTWVRLLLSTYFSGHCNINNIQGTYLDYQPHFYKALLIDGSKPKDVMHVRTAALYHMNKFWAGPFLKTHWGNYEAFGVKAIPPQLTKRAIVVVRDPRDLVISLANFYQQSFDEVIANLNSEKAGTFEDYKYYLLSDWSTWLRSWKCPDFEVIFIKYEDLLADTVSVFSNLLNLLELPIKNVDKIIELTNFEQLKQQETDKGFVEQKNGAVFFNNGRTTYQDKLTPAQIQKIETFHQEEMKAFGYEGHYFSPD